MTKFLVSYLHKTGRGSCIISDKENTKITEKFIIDAKKSIEEKYSFEGVGITNVIKLEDEE